MELHYARFQAMILKYFVQSEDIPDSHFSGKRVLSDPNVQAPIRWSVGTFRVLKLYSWMMSHQNECVIAIRIHGLYRLTDSSLQWLQWRNSVRLFIFSRRPSFIEMTTFVNLECLCFSRSTPARVLEFSMLQIAHLTISFTIYKHILYSMMLCTTRNIMIPYMQQPINFVVGCNYHSPPTVTACVLDVVLFINPSP